jgi:uncharacterized protein involved in response to NO
MSVPAALARRRDYSGPALFSYGFRPFFLAGAAWAAFGILLWLPQYMGEITLTTTMQPLDWHIHEMFYGYVAAVVTGFLLTAIPNWTGRLPICGPSLALLAALWLLGRIAILTSASIGTIAAAVIDVSFLVVIAIVALREIVAGKNWRNLRVLVILGVLIAGNVLFHVEVIRHGVADYGARTALAAVLCFIMLIGGRVVPSFTHNWLVRNNPGRLPIPFSRFDALALAGAIVALAAWVAQPDHVATGVLFVAAGVLHALRLGRWAGDRTVAERLVVVLHVAYAFVPLGFLLAGGAILWPAVVPGSAAIHAWTTGAVGMMTLAVMTRASLGHTGHPLTASAATQAIYLLVFVAALVRIAAAFVGSIALLHLATFVWIAAFGGFVLAYGPLLVRRRPNWAAQP